jgi:hypothetical protein
MSHLSLFSLGFCPSFSAEKYKNLIEVLELGCVSILEEKGGLTLSH